MSAGLLDVFSNKKDSLVVEKIFLFLSEAASQLTYSACIVIVGL